ncbi:hypothetical protein F7Q99_03260 [Streptomyces kaniharaensis]|uniref:Uncharacterized protein n=1 Tax=Streptomyces kaniharaensis TaxID=212423 RepID=A0A6N7KNY5_9ACTN|nr:hypothetical protein [Streptomyces kaniharaensis]MQS11333.1 hypothetical protein [Streptomyces kaniharaensis]
MTARQATTTRAVALAGALALPYIAVKSYWAAGGRAGLADGFELAGEFERNGAPEALVWLERHGVDFTAVLALAGLAVAAALVLPFGRRIPARLLLVPAGAGALLAAYGTLTALVALAGNGGRGPVTGWVVPAGTGAFVGIGTALAAAAWSRLRRDDRPVTV